MAKSSSYYLYRLVTQKWCNFLSFPIFAYYIRKYWLCRYTLTSSSRDLHYCYNTVWLLSLSFFLGLLLVSSIDGSFYVLLISEMVIDQVKPCSSAVPNKHVSTTASLFILFSIQIMEQSEQRIKRLKHTLLECSDLRMICVQLTFAYLWGEPSNYWGMFHKRASFIEEALLILAVLNNTCFC